VHHQQGVIIGLCRRWQKGEGSGDYFAVIDHLELVMQLVAASEAGSSDAFQIVIQG